MSGKLCALPAFETSAAQSSNGFHPAENLLDSHAYPLADNVTAMATRSGVDGRTAMGTLGDVWRDVRLSARFDKIDAVIPPIGTNSDSVAALSLEHFDSCLPLAAAVGFAYVEFDQQSMPVFHQCMAAK